MEAAGVSSQLVQSYLIAGTGAQTDSVAPVANP